MRHRVILSLCLSGTFLVAGCAGSGEAEVERAIRDLNVIDESNLNDLMLSTGDPKEAVAYFRRTAEQNPDRIDIKRGLAKSLVRAGQPKEAVGIWREIVTLDETTNSDRVDLADALIRAGDWDEAEAELDSVPPTFETFKRYRLEAMIADSNEEWENADSFYETAAGLTTRPAGVLNNWGYSMLTRGNYAEAERLFVRAISNDRDMFTAKNNLVLARGAQGNYDLPVIEMSQIERAQLLHTLGLSAVKRGDITIGRGLLKEAIDTHPQYFEAAVRALRALEDNVNNG